MSTQQVSMTLEATQLLACIVDTAEEFAAWIEEQLNTKTEAGMTHKERFALDDMAVLAETMVNFKAEYLTPTPEPGTTLIYRSLLGNVRVYWDGKGWTEHKHQARVYTTPGTARGVITRKVALHVKRYSQGITGIYTINKWASAYTEAA